MKNLRRLLSLFGLVLLACTLASCSDIIGVGDDSDSDSDATAEEGGG